MGAHELEVTGGAVGPGPGRATARASPLPRRGRGQADGGCRLAAGLPDCEEGGRGRWTTFVRITRRWTTPRVATPSSRSRRSPPARGPVPSSAGRRGTRTGRGNVAAAARIVGPNRGPRRALAGRGAGGRGGHVSRCPLALALVLALASIVIRRVRTAPGAARMGRDRGGASCCPASPRRGSPATA